ncbi:unnamed protein product [Meloidogyne enterolobii]|uniref:Uncharacterized protein n=1 Tax=Meloidogyne enterolobii TaxID=390850 RepID=A0ACB1AYP3_MELEN
MLVKTTKLLQFNFFKNFPKFACQLSFQRNISSITKQNNQKQNFNLINNNSILNRTSIEDLQQEGFPFWQMKLAVENAINENLEKGKFFHAQNVWKMFVDNTQSTFGILSLIEFSLQNFEGYKLRQNIASLWHESKTLLSASDFIAYLVIAMMKTGYIEEANIFAKKFTIFGTSFILPFKEAVEKEKFSLLLENVFFSVPELTKELKAKRKAEMIERKLKNAEKLENERLDDEKLEEMIEENEERKVFKIVEQERKPPFIFQNLIWIWAPPRKINNSQKDVLIRPNKPRKQRIHKVNLKSLEKFCIEFIELWQLKAVQNSDFYALECCHSFIKRNGLSNTLSTQTSRQEGLNNPINNKQLVFN